MVTPKSQSPPLQKAFEKAIGHLKNRMPKRIYVAWNEDSDMSSQLREEHVRYCKEKKTYFPIKITYHDGIQEIVCCIDRTDAASMGTFSRKNGSIPQGRSLTGMLSFLYGKGTKETHDYTSKVAGFNSIDRHYKIMLDANMLTNIAETMPGLTQQRLDVVVTERMQYAFKSLCSYLTLKHPSTAPGISAAFVFASFSMGYGYGIPIIPRKRHMWASLLGIGDDFETTAKDAYDYLVCEAYLERMFPMMGLVTRETLLAGHDKYLKALRSYALGSLLTHEMIKEIKMEPEDVDRRIREIGLVYD